MLPDFLPAAEVLAKGVKHVACYVADAIAERRNAFSDDEDGDYLACAGADGLTEALSQGHGSYKLSSGRMKDGPDAAGAWHWCVEHNMRTIRCVNMPHAEGDEWTPAAHGAAADGPAEACDIPRSPSAGHPLGFSSLREMFESAPLRTDPPKPQTDAHICKHCAGPIELHTEEHRHLGRAGIWLHRLGDGKTRIACRPTYASPQ